MAEVSIQSLPFVPAGGRVERLEVRACYFESSIDTRTFRARHLHYPVLVPDPLIIEPSQGHFVVIAKFGSVVFWNCPAAVRRQILDEVAASTEAARGGERLKESMDVLVGQSDNTVTFDEVGLRELSLPKLKIISLALAQSVALDRIEKDVVAALKQFEPVVAELRAGGKLRLNARQVLKAVGFALDVRQAVLAKLTLFDKPPETWESEFLERLDAQLYDFFDLEERMDAINQKVAYFSEVNATLMNVLNHRKSVRLEWIIIILIFIEVVLFLLVELRGRT